jgi:hypothetical protein
MYYQDAPTILEPFQGSKDWNRRWIPACYAGLKLANAFGVLLEWLKKRDDRCVKKRETRKESLKNQNGNPRGMGLPF